MKRNHDVVPSADVRCAVCGDPVTEISRRRGTYFRHDPPPGHGYGPQQIPAIERFWGSVDKSGDCWIWTGARRRGYGVFRLSNPRRMVDAHRFSLEQALGRDLKP